MMRVRIASVFGGLVPAHRSRTERWRDLLRQIAERGGGLEFSVAKGASGPEHSNSPDLVWRVRLLGITDTQLLLEQPVAMGSPIKFEPGMELVAVMSVGQNRWMFHTKVLGPADGPSVFGAQRGLRVAAPTNVERCARRDFLRISTAELRLPQVRCWPLLDPSSVVAAEVANRAHILELERGAGSPQVSEDSVLLPEVGPPFSAKLLNIGGGGVGLLIGRDEAPAAERARLIWMRVDLVPQIRAPLGLTARVVHTHLDSAQNLYAGAAFDFAFNPGHRDFVVEQVTRYVSRVQAQARAAA
jgi:hypothetical protein